MHKFSFFSNNISNIFEKLGGRFMKATGVVRRIDDLGRLVIPKEIRKVLRIKERRPDRNIYRKRRRSYFKKIFTYR